MKLNRPMQVYLHALLVALLTWAALGSLALAKSVQTVAEGVGAIVGDNAGIARDEALRDAQRRAIEQVMGTEVRSNTLVVGLEVALDQVSTRSSGFLSKRRVISEGREGNLYRVRIEAEVDVDRLLSDLQDLGLIIRTVLGNPRVLILTLAKGSKVPQGALETSFNTLQELLVSRGFDVVDFEQTSTLVRKLGPATTDAQLVNLARTTKADLLLRASVRVEDLGSTLVGRERFESVQTEIALDAISTGTAQVLASKTGRVTKASVTRNLAAEDAARAVLETGVQAAVVNQVIGVLNTSTGATARKLTVTVRGLPDYDAFQKVYSALQTVRGLLEGSVQDRSFENGEGVFDAQGSVAARDIAQVLSTLPGLKLKVESVGASAVVLSYRP